MSLLCSTLSGEMKSRATVGGKAADDDGGVVVRHASDQRDCAPFDNSDWLEHSLDGTWSWKTGKRSRDYTVFRARSCGSGFAGLRGLETWGAVLQQCNRPSTFVLWSSSLASVLILGCC